MNEKREKQLREAKAKFGNRNLMEELEWQRNCFTIGYVDRKYELYNLWIFNECYERLKAAQIPLTEMKKFRIFNFQCGFKKTNHRTLAK